MTTRSMTSLPFAVLCLALLMGSGCKSGGEQPSSQPDPVEPKPAKLSFTVSGNTLEVQSAVLLWRDRADDAQLFFADQEGLCEKLSAGAWPREAMTLVIALKNNARELRDAPWGSGDYPLRTGGTRAPRDTKRAIFRQLGSDCRPTFQAPATAGKVRLTGPEAVLGGKVSGELDLTFGADRATGSFSATVCKQPEYEPRDCK